MYENSTFFCLCHRLFSSFALLLFIGAGGFGCGPSGAEEAVSSLGNVESDDVETDYVETDDVRAEDNQFDVSELETDDTQERPFVDDSAAAAAGVRLTDGYAVIADYTGGVGVALNVGATFSTPVSIPVHCVSQEELISFIDDHSELFTDGELEMIRSHRAYRERGYGAELLSGLLGLKLAADFAHYTQQTEVDLSAENEAAGLQGNALLDALKALEEKAYTLKGTMSAVGLSPIPASPRFLVGVAELTFASGRRVRVINTRIRVTDADGSQSFVREKTDDAPLRLEAETPPAKSITLSHGFVAAAHLETGLKTGEEATVQIEREIEVVPHRDLVSFIEGNADLFSEEALDTIRRHVSYTDESRAPALLLGILGLKLGGDFDYFSTGSGFDIFPFNGDDEDFITSLGELSDKTMTLSGKHIAVGNFGIATIPYVYLDRVRIAFADGAVIHVVDTHAEVADDAGNRDCVFSKAGQAPLSLE